MYLSNKVVYQQRNTVLVTLEKCIYEENPFMPQSTYALFSGFLTTSPTVCSFCDTIHSLIHKSTHWLKPHPTPPPPSVRTLLMAQYPYACIYHGVGTMLRRMSLIVA